MTFCPGDDDGAAAAGGSRLAVITISGSWVGGSLVPCTRLAASAASEAVGGPNCRNGPDISLPVPNPPAFGVKTRPVTVSRTRPRLPTGTSVELVCAVEGTMPGAGCGAVTASIDGGGAFFGRSLNGTISSVFS